MSRSGGAAIVGEIHLMYDEGERERGGDCKLGFGERE